MSATSTSPRTCRDPCLRTGINPLNFGNLLLDLLLRYLVGLGLGEPSSGKKMNVSESVFCKLISYIQSFRTYPRLSYWELKLSTAWNTDDQVPGCLPHSVHRCQSGVVPCQHRLEQRARKSAGPAQTNTLTKYRRLCQSPSPSVDKPASHLHQVPTSSPFIESSTTRARVWENISPESETNMTRYPRHRTFAFAIRGSLYSTRSKLCYQLIVLGLWIVRHLGIWIKQINQPECERGIGTLTYSLRYQSNPVGPGRTCNAVFHGVYCQSQDQQLISSCCTAGHWVLSPYSMANH